MTSPPSLVISVPSPNTTDVFPPRTSIPVRAMATADGSSDGPPAFDGLTIQVDNDPVITLERGSPYLTFQISETGLHPMSVGLNYSLDPQANGSHTLTVTAEFANSRQYTLRETVSFSVGVPVPVVSTGAVSQISLNSATLNGTVNPEGFPATCHFDYGLTASYGSSAPVPDASAGSGSTPQPVSQPISGLQPSTLYHYRLTATNGGGSASTADATFATPPPVTRDATWSNWGITDSPTSTGRLFTPALFKPTDADGISSAIIQAESASQAVRAVGSGFSFSEASF